MTANSVRRILVTALVGGILLAATARDPSAQRNGGVPRIGGVWT
jgi:hypothetical protein